MTTGATTRSDFNSKWDILRQNESVNLHAFGSVPAEHRCEKLG
ncbi:MAG: hypothetical protein OXB99_15705 [Acidimicrobiaceae bacterium]|nr:hypothetical protein [Acidimicrobiaceae bacterium]